MCAWLIRVRILAESAAPLLTFGPARVRLSDQPPTLYWQYHHMYVLTPRLGLVDPEAMQCGPGEIELVSLPL